MSSGSSEWAKIPMRVTQLVDAGEGQAGLDAGVVGEGSGVHEHPDREPQLVGGHVDVQVGVAGALRDAGRCAAAGAGACSRGCPPRHDHVGRGRSRSPPSRRTRHRGRPTPTRRWPAPCAPAGRRRPRPRRGPAARSWPSGSSACRARDRAPPGPRSSTRRGRSAPGRRCHCRRTRPAPRRPRGSGTSRLIESPAPGPPRARPGSRPAPGRTRAAPARRW